MSVIATNRSCDYWCAGAVFTLVRCVIAGWAAMRVPSTNLAQSLTIG
jgi:hypothetical protein